MSRTDGKLLARPRELFGREHGDGVEHAISSPVVEVDQGVHVLGSHRRQHYTAGDARVVAPAAPPTRTRRRHVPVTTLTLLES